MGASANDDEVEESDIVAEGVEGKGEEKHRDSDYDQRGDFATLIIPPRAKQIPRHHC